MKERIVFLDIDGVLNTPKSVAKCIDCICIDDDKLQLLKEIIDATGSKIVLISTWKESWERLPSRKHLQDDFANYLDKKFKAAGFSVFDKTLDYLDGGLFLSRGEGIVEYIKRTKPISFVILDDIKFDYNECGLTENFIKIKSRQGLQNIHVQKAIEILNKR